MSQDNKISGLLGNPIEFGKDVIEEPHKDWVGRTTRSIALISCFNGTGCIMAHEGPDMFYEMESIPEIDLKSHGMENAPNGLSIWEGQMLGGEYDAWNGDYNDTVMKGKFRSLTKEEHDRLMECKTPWVTIE
jgi:hypothetical protein